MSIFFGVLCTFLEICILLGLGWVFIFVLAILLKFTPFLLLLLSHTVIQMDSKHAHTLFQVEPLVGFFSLLLERQQE